MSKLFTSSDVAYPFDGELYGKKSNCAGCGMIYASREDLIYAPLDWQKQGLQQSASGYGSKLTSSNKIMFNGKAYRLYITCYGNAGSAWFIANGVKIFVD